MNKSILKSVMAMFALMLVFTLSSCQKDDAVAPEYNYDADVMLATSEWIEGDLIEGTVETEFALDAQYDKMLFDGNVDKPGKPGDKRPPMLPLGRLLRQLELTADQRDSVEIYMQAFRLCAEEARIALRDAQKPIIDSANAQRRAIIADLKAGLITRQEASLALRQLHEATKLALDSDPAVVAAREAIKNCHDILLANIKSLLTPAQLVIWERFMSQTRP